MVVVEDPVEPAPEFDGVIVSFGDVSDEPVVSFGVIADPVVPAAPVVSFVVLEVAELSAGGETESFSAPVVTAGVSEALSSLSEQAPSVSIAAAPAAKIKAFIMYSFRKLTLPNKRATSHSVHKFQSKRPTNQD